jgi:hypothetical protein
LRFVFYVSDDGSAVTGVTANNFGAPALDTVYQIICKHDSVNNQISIKVNNGTADTTAHSTGIFNSGTNFNIGALNGTTFWNGLIRRVRTWDRVTTTDEDTWLYNAGTGRSYADLQAGMGGDAPTLSWMPRTQIVRKNNIYVVSSGMIPPEKPE